MALAEGQRIQIVDARTGEVITETSHPDAGVFLGRRRKFPGGFVIVFESEFRAAALLLKDYGVLPMCLWNVLFTKVEIGTGEILVNTVELAEMVKSHQPNVSKAIKLLAELGLIMKVRKDGKNWVYRINPSVMWKGKETERQHLLKVIQGG